MTPTSGTENKWIVSDTDHLGGEPRIQGTRISVSFLLELLSTGMSIKDIVREYPSLSEEAVRGTLSELSESESLVPK
jgi:uncharacterized protein (DUF433 family)